MKEKTKKPRYNLGQNVLWMLRQAHAVHRDDVPVITVIRALAVAGTGISGLLLAPEIIRCVERGIEDVSTADKVIAGVYPDSAQATIANEEFMSEYSNDVLEAISNLYLNHEVVLEVV